jgi:uncharacterized membrane protein YccC
MKLLFVVLAVIAFGFMVPSLGYFMLGSVIGSILFIAVPFVAYSYWDCRNS